MLKQKPTLVIFCSLIMAFLLWLVMSVCDSCGQRKLFYREGSELLSDYWMPRVTLSEGYQLASDSSHGASDVQQSGWVDGKMCVLDYDRCYPAAALMPLSVFPESWIGAYAWSVFAIAFFLGALCWVSGSCAPVILALSMPVLYCLERGNEVAISAACVAVFLSWYRSGVRWQRLVASFALSCAVCFKVSPVLLGVLYLREKDWVGIGLTVGFSMFLFTLPWFLVPGGFSSLPIMMKNASANALNYARTSEFGLIGLWRAIRVLFRQDCVHIWPGCLEMTRLSQILGFVALGWGAWRRNLLWVVLGMMWAAGNMHYYGAMYLLPIFLIEIKTSPNKWLRLALWFLILCPLQFVIGGHSANGVLCNLASLGLIFIPHRSVVV